MYYFYCIAGFSSCMNESKVLCQLLSHPVHPASCGMSGTGIKTKQENVSQFKYFNIPNYKGWDKSHGNYFFNDTSPVGICDIYRRKDKVLITCVDMNRTDIS